MDVIKRLSQYVIHQNTPLYMDGWAAQVLRELFISPSETLHFLIADAIRDGSCPGGYLSHDAMRTLPAFLVCTGR